MSKYSEEQAKAGFSIGDRVLITTKATQGQRGWETSWNPSMDKTIGSTGVVVSVSKTWGVLVKVDMADGGSLNWYYPFYVLQNISKEKLDPREQYLAGQEASGIKPGDWVKVTRAAEDHEQGWGNSWASSMDDSIGKTLRVSSVDGASGIYLEKSGAPLDYYFPFFVLEPVSNQAFFIAFFTKAKEATLKAILGEVTDTHVAIQEAITQLMAANTKEEFHAGKKALLRAYFGVSLLSVAHCIYCPTVPSPELCEPCEYGATHGICIKDGSEYAKLTKAIKNVLNLLEKY